MIVLYLCLEPQLISFIYFFLLFLRHEKKKKKKKKKGKEKLMEECGNTRGV
jgi:hypothetical protein